MPATRVRLCLVGVQTPRLAVHLLVDVGTAAARHVTRGAAAVLPCRVHGVSGEKGWHDSTGLELGQLACLCVHEISQALQRR